MLTKRMNRSALLLAFWLTAIAYAGDLVETERLGTLRFFDGMPDEATVKKVYDQLDFSRGVQTFLTGIPAASMYGMLEGMKEAGIGPNMLGIAEELLDARSLWLTPWANLEVILSRILF